MKFYSFLKKHEKKMKLLLVFVIFLFCIYFLKPLLQKNTVASRTVTTPKGDKYKNLIDNFENIFPDFNRNAGGPQFFNWINNNFKDSQDFVDYCKLYCPISGSPIDPKNKVQNSSVIEIKNVFDSNKTKGKMYRCCWPCLCDAIKYVKCDKFTRKDGSQYMVLVINDPCHFEANIPKEVTSYRCNENNKTSNGVYSDNGKLIIGLLHSVPSNTPTNIPDNCTARNSKEPDSLQNGMGDIFVKLTQVDKQIAKPTLNVYNEELKSCPDKSDSKIGGSWDENLKCSEVDGGVHQICYRDIGIKADKFSENTGQSDWSTDRGTNNHCVCLGAWSLYEKKIATPTEKQSNIASARLKCEAIPNIALTNNYVKNFSSWNGLERDGQIKDGVEGLVKECIKDAKDDKEKIGQLIKNYCKFADSVDHKKVPIKYDINTGNFNDFYDKFCN